LLRVARISVVREFPRLSGAASFAASFAESFAESFAGSFAAAFFVFGLPSFAERRLLVAMR
jgi:hypothetical protein